MIAYLAAHWGTIVAVGLPILLVLIASLISQFQDPDNNPATPPPGWVQLLMVCQKVLTFRSPAGTTGIAGTRWSVPVLHYPKELDSAPPASPPSPPPAAVFIPFLIIGSLLIPACSCWKPERRNDVGCVVLRQIVDCTKDAAVSTLVPSVVSIIQQLIAGQTAVDWAAVEQKLELMGIRDGGCILASLEDDFISKASASPMAAAHAIPVRSMRERWTINHKLQGIKYKLKNGHLL